MKSIQGMFRQLPGDAVWSLAVNGETSVTVVVIEISAEALLARFKAQASGPPSPKRRSGSRIC
jgi:hypothetical protein